MLTENLTAGPELENSQGQTRKPQSEHNESGLPPIADIERTSRHVANAPARERFFLKKADASFSAGHFYEACLTVAEAMREE
jgi:hypothetical protein